MFAFILDTDHVSLLLRGQEDIAQRLSTYLPMSIAVTVVTAQELLDGWLPLLKRSQPVERAVWAYAGFRRTLEFLCDAHLLDFDEQVAETFEQLRGKYPRLGTNDLRIAAIALRLGATVITRNVRHFSQVEGLKVENWADG